MTIRSGGRARERSQARPADPGTYDEAWQPAYAPETTTDRAGRGGRGGRGGGGGYNGGGYNGWDRRPRRGIPGILKFLLFALVLGGIVIVVLLTALRPLVRDTVVKWAADNPAALGIGFVKDLVEEDLGDKLTKAASGDTTQVPFVVNQGETAAAIASRLQDNGFLADRRAFIFIATEQGLTSKLAAGTFILRRSMTPSEVVSALLSPQQVQYIDIALRTGLRLEQITAKLETIDGLTMDPKDFYELAKHPTAELLGDYPWLKEILPEGASLEGFLWPATYRVLPDTTAEELVRDMLDGFKDAIGDRMTVPAARKLTFYQVLSLASIVEKEAQKDVDRPLIAGVFQNRLNPKLFPNLHLGSDPTVFFIHDTIKLGEADLATWKSYLFWAALPEGYQLPAELPDDLAGYNTYTHQGLIPGPICTPTIESIDAALAPDTKDKFLYFLATKDGTIVYAKTKKQHDQNRAKYGL
ncbi:MAG TPA: endolytic transglycosylase MltG [Candidatus Limnocylindrales bacterium]|nr:endolytic transglycosylase MltG [Candidatus Limnocylindrales bacterium]